MFFICGEGGRPTLKQNRPEFLKHESARRESTSPRLFKLVDCSLSGKVSPEAVPLLASLLESFKGPVLCKVHFPNVF